MKKTIMTLIAASAFAMTAMGVTECPGEPTPEPTSQWYVTCGDPVCSGYHGPYDDVPLCVDQVDGDPCSAEGDVCDPQSECGSLMMCSEDDPKSGGCPISAAHYKQDISYLGPDELTNLHKQVMDAPLATWKYRTEGELGKTRLGFIIEDQPKGSFAVDEPRDMVDVYAWSTMAVAALKVQQQQIDALRQEVQALKAQKQSAPSPASNQ